MKRYNDASSQNEKMDQEKLSLARELDRIRPQLEQLRSQVDSNKTLVAKKGELERRVDTLEVELENEKRSKLRLQQQHDSQLDELRSKLKHEKELHTSETKVAYQSQKKPAQSLKKSPKKKDKSKAEIPMRAPVLSPPHEEVFTPIDVGELETTVTPVPQIADVSGTQEKISRERAGRKSAKKNTGSFETTLAGLTIQTPGNPNLGRRQNTKVGGLGRVPVGGKSTFSITPFLNKTRNIEDESSEAEPPKATASDDDFSDNDFPTPEIIKPRQRCNKPNKVKPSPKKATSVPDSKPQPAKGRSRSKVLQDSPGSSANRSMETSASRERGKSKNAEPLKETSTAKRDQNKENMPASNSELGAKEAHQHVTTASADSVAEKKKRKRKLLGGARKAVFDEEEADAEEVSHMLDQPITKKRLKAPLGGLSNAFAEAAATFSPLKRDRRGFNASFLGPQ